MQRILLFLLISSIALVVNSCSDESPFFDVDNTAPVIAEVTAVTTPSNDNTPDYTFSSTESGSLYFEGSCSSSTTSVSSGDNTITLNSLSDGTYSDCEITVSDTAANESNSITLTSFTIDSTAATLVETSAIDSSTNDSTPDYTFVSSEAGTITYSGSCSSSTTSAIAGTNTITLNTLSDGTYSDCKITVTDSLENAVTLNIGSFVIDTTAPTVTSVSTNANNQSSVAITDNISVTFSKAMDTTSVTTNTSNTSCSGTLRVSSDNFSNCVQMASSPSSSNSDKTFTLDPSDNLTAGTTYKTRVTTGVKDAAGNALSSQYETSSGFTTYTNLMGGAIQGTELSLSTAVTTFAGQSDNDSTDGTGTAARFYSPIGITTDGENLYVADAGNNRIRKIVIDNGTVTTLAGSSQGYSDNAIGTSASFNGPRGITTDGENLYVVDYGNHLIRKIVISTGAVTTLAGTAGTYGSADNTTGTSASFKNPWGITTDGTNLYVADMKNYTIRKIVISTGAVTTLAGTPGSLGNADNAIGTSASFNWPIGITTDGTNLYVTETHSIRKIVIDNGTVTTLAGSSSHGDAASIATGTSARFKYPRGITTDGTNLYVVDNANFRIRKIVIDNGTVTSLAGSSGGFRDNNTSTLAKFNYPQGITTDGENLYVTDGNNHRIRKIE